MLFQLKTVLSVLVYSDGLDDDLIDSGADFPINPDPNIESFLEVFNKLNYPYYIRNNLFDLMEELNNYNSYFNTENTMLLLNQLEEIGNKLRGNPIGEKIILEELKNLFWTIVGERVRQRYNYVKACKKYVMKTMGNVYNNVMGEYTDADILRMCLMMQPIIPDMIKKIIKYETEEFLIPAAMCDEYSLLESINDSLNKAREKLDDWLVKKYTTSNGCFVIMTTDSNQKYSSLSGKLEIESPNKVSLLAKYISDNVLNVDSGGVTYKWCPLNGNTLRFTELLNENQEQIDKYIDNPIKKSSDFPIPKDEDNKNIIGITYGCCERKIIGYTGFKSFGKFYSRWSPCWKCMPAIYKYPCDYYSYAKNFKDWAATKSPKWRRCKIVITYVKKYNSL